MKDEFGKTLNVGDYVHSSANSPISNTLIIDDDEPLEIIGFKMGGTMLSTLEGILFFGPHSEKMVKIETDNIKKDIIKWKLRQGK